MELINSTLTPDYMFFKLDKYRRPMFFVQSEELEKLYEECQAINKNVSLFKNDDGYLILVLSNPSDRVINSKKLPKIKISVYKDSIRFYEAMKIVFTKNKIKKIPKRDSEDSDDDYAGLEF